MWPRPKRGGRAEIKERRRDKEKEERDNAAPNVIMQWTGLAIGGGARWVFFLCNFFIFIFSAGEVARRRASLVPNSGAGPRYRATSERHTHTGLDKAGVC